MIFGPQHFYARYSVKPRANRSTALLDVTCCIHLHTLLHACCWELLCKVWNWSNFWAKNSQHFFCSVSSATMLDPFAQLFPTLMGPRMHITNGLQSLMSCILPMMHCWEFLHPFTHQCQNGCNNSQYCWPNSVGSCCIHLQVTLGSEEFKLPTYQL